MDAYDDKLAPEPFGLNNTGVICYLNSYLQMLAGCTSFSRAILQNANYAARTRTGRAMIAFVRAFITPVPDLPYLSSDVLAALTADLAERRPHVRFGSGQESASELFVHLLDMMEPPSASATASTALHVASVESPITRLFLHRFRCELHCRQCRNIVSSETDYAVVFNLFHLDQMRLQPASVRQFSDALRRQVSETDNYQCPTCKTGTKAIRVYSLTMVPEIIVCAFNLYVEFGGARRARYFPRRVAFPAVDGGKLAFRIVGQVEHSGTLSGGHYWARGLRAGGEVYLLNDSGVSHAEFTPTANTYMLAFHFEVLEGPEDDGITGAA